MPKSTDRGNPTADQHLLSNLLADEVDRVKDWLHGVRQEAPEKDMRASLSQRPLSEAERLRIVYEMITNPHEEGGAGIIAQEGEWENVDSIFPLHDDAFNNSWLKSWSTRYTPNIEDLDQVRDKFGEKVAFYFAFLQSYFAFLIFPAAIGFTAWLMLGGYSVVYAIINGLWCVTFVEWWKHQEADLAVRWGVRGVSGIQIARREFVHEKEVKDQVTGEVVKVFPATKRLSRQLLQVPFALAAVLLLGTLIATCFGIEIFISEVYNGPFKGYLVSYGGELPGVSVQADSSTGLPSHRPAHDLHPDAHDNTDGLCQASERFRKLPEHRRLRCSLDPEGVRVGLHHLLHGYLPDGVRLCSFWELHRAVPRCLWSHGEVLR